MKYKLSISVDEKTLDMIQKGIQKGQFRNRSHAFEYAISQLVGGDE